MAFCPHVYPHGAILKIFVQNMVGDQWSHELCVQMLKTKKDSIEMTAMWEGVQYNLHTFVLKCKTGERERG